MQESDEREPMDGASIVAALETVDTLLFEPEGYSTFAPVHSKAHSIADEDAKDYVEVQIPFCGTYETILSSKADDVAYILTHECWNDRTRQELLNSKVFKEFLTDLEEYEIEAINNKERVLDIGFSVNLEQYLVEYIAYVQHVLEQQIGHPFERNLVLSEMVSPKEYNFTTDTLWAYMHKDDWEALKPKEVMETDAYKEWAKPLYTPRDGYFPWYSEEDYFVPSSTLRCSLGVLSYHIANHISEYMEDASEDGSIKLHDVGYDLATYLFEDGCPSLDITGIEDCDLYLRNSDPKRYEIK